MELTLVKIAARAAGSFPARAALPNANLTTHPQTVSPACRLKCHFAEYQTSFFRLS